MTNKETEELIKLMEEAEREEEEENKIILTSQDIIRWVRKVLYGPCYNENYDACVCEKLINIVEQSERYKWHDLRKDPTDLPNEMAEVAVMWVNHNPESYYESIKDKPFMAFAIYGKGKWWWWSVGCEDLLREYGRSEPDVIDDAIEIIAWREIEPFEEGEKE